MIGTATAVLRRVAGFPTVVLDEPAVDVSLIAQLAPGSGTLAANQVAARQRGHADYVDALDEPSAKLAGVVPGRGDPSSLYSFCVGSGGHPFHRHAGSRAFTAVAGSSGAQLRFSSLSLESALESRAGLAAAMHVVHVPPDALFTVRMGNGVWHQFLPGDPGAGQPAFFALSFHPDETSGIADPDRRGRILANEAGIAMLTEVLPEAVQRTTARALDEVRRENQYWLALAAAPEGLRARLCRAARVASARVRTLLALRPRASSGFTRTLLPGLVVHEASEPVPCSLLDRCFQPIRLDHQDRFTCVVDAEPLAGWSASDILDGLLRDFVDNPPVGVTGLMMLRNALVWPLGLRRSRLGCPVSSLKGSDPCGERFASRHPVLAQETSADGLSAKVVLGADDRHLRFRTCVGVRWTVGNRLEVSFANRVECRNWFGRAYIRAIHGAHRRYIVPALIRSGLAGVLLAARGRPRLARALGSDVWRPSRAPASPSVSPAPYSP